MMMLEMKLVKIWVMMKKLMFFLFFYPFYWVVFPPFSRH